MGSGMEVRPDHLLRAAWWWPGNPQFEPPWAACDALQPVVPVAAQTVSGVSQARAGQSSLALKACSGAKKRWERVVQEVGDDFDPRGAEASPQSCGQS